MDHRRINRLNRRDKHNTFSHLYLQVDGSALPNGTATNAGLTVGRDVAVARDDGSNAVTITFNEPLENAPLVFWSPITDNVEVKIVTNDGTTLAYTTVDSDSNGTGVNDADVNFLLVVPLGPEVR